MSDAVVPSWEGVRERRIARLRRVDAKLVTAVLIGLVSVTGAVITWKSSQLGEKAVDMDRQAIAETVLVEQSIARIEVQVRDEHEAFVQYKERLKNAALLETEADNLGRSGLAIEAGQARDEAGVQREEANSLTGLSSLDLSYVSFGDDGVPTDLNVDQLRADLRAGDDQAAKLNPDRTVAQAVDYRNRSQRLEGWTIPLVLAVVLLTFATITRSVRARPWVASAAVVIFVLSASIALLGD